MKDARDLVVTEGVRGVHIQQTFNERLGGQASARHFHILIHSTLTMMQCRHECPHFTDDKTVAREEPLLPRFTSQGAAELECSPRPNAKPMPSSP